MILLWYCFWCLLLTNKHHVWGAPHCSMTSPSLGIKMSTAMPSPWPSFFPHIHIYICIDKYTYIYIIYISIQIQVQIQYATLLYHTIQYIIYLDPPFLPIKSVLYMFYSMSCFGFLSSFTIFLGGNILRVLCGMVSIYRWVCHGWDVGHYP